MQGGCVGQRRYKQELISSFPIIGNFFRDFSNHWKTVAAAFGVMAAALGATNATACSNLTEATHAPQYSWTSGGDAEWFAQTNMLREGGSCAAQAGDVDDEESSWIQTEVTGRGMVSFYWKVSSEEGWDNLRFRINGELREEISGEVDWEQKQFEVDGSVSTLRWEYAKDGSVSEGADTGWMTDFEFVRYTGKVLIASGSLAFGKVALGTNAQRVLTVRCPGDEGVAVTNILLPTGFTASPTAFNLTPGETAEVVVAFAPINPVLYSGNCVVGSDAQAGLASLPVSGIGLIVADRFVATNSPAPAAPYTNWTTAAHTIQEALDFAGEGDTVWVTNGVYDRGGQFLLDQTNRIVVGTGVVVRSVNGPEVTHIVGAADPANAYGFDAAAIRGVVLLDNAVLDGFTVRDGCAVSDSYGGGVLSGLGGVGRRRVDAADEMARITNCVIRGNRAMMGGGVFGLAGYDSIIESNFSLAMGGGGTEVWLVNCVVRGNESTMYGGGVCGGIAEGCRIEGNRAQRGGGLYRMYRVQNSRILGNTATMQGGGAARCDDEGGLENCVVLGNTAAEGGGLYDSRAINSIVYYNTAETGPNWDELSYLAFSCSTPMPEGDYGTNNISGDPRLVSLASPHLFPDSPCINAGTNQPWMADALDMDGEPRLNGVVDMGVDEFWANGLTDILHVAISLPLGREVTPGYALTFEADVAARCAQAVWELDGFALTNVAFFSHTFTNTGDFEVRLTASNDTGAASATVTVTVWNAAFYVTPGGNDANDGKSWELSKQTIQSAVDACLAPGGVVWVSNGVYNTGGCAVFGHSNRVAVTRPITVRSVNGAAVTEIHGASDPASTNVLGLGSNAVRCVYMGGGAKIEGFTLRGGRSSDNMIFLRGSDITSRGFASTAPSRGVPISAMYMFLGGGVCCETTNDVISQCIISDNAAVAAGWVIGGTISHSVIESNKASIMAGGAFQSSLTHSRILGNQAENGAGIHMSRAWNCLITGNEASERGGGATDSALFNCTVVGNRAGQGIGGIQSGVCVNSIVYHNEAPEYPNWEEFADAQFTNTCTTPLPEGPGCFDAAPALSSNFMLTAASSCVNTGLNDAWMAGATDLAGSNRVIGGIVDVGAFEYDLTPGNLSAAFIGGVALSWQLPQGVASCAVYRAETDTPPAEPLAAFAATNAWADATTQPGQCYYYWVRTITGSDVSPLSEVVHICTPELPTNTHFVWVGSQNPQAPYTNWLTAATNIQDAVNVAPAGATVLVGDGVYAHGWANDPDREVEPIVLKSRVFVTNNIALRSLNGAMKTTILGEGPSGTGAVRCVTLLGASSLDGFLLKDGHVAISQGYDMQINHAGGGLFLNGDASVSNCVVMGCDGSGVANENGGHLADCMIVDNQGRLGGGLNLKGAALIERCSIVDNMATDNHGERGSGGGASLEYDLVSDSSPVMRNCFIADNLAASQRVGGGGGVVLGGGHLYNCTIINNRSMEYGGGLFVGASMFTQQVVNCIVYHNTAPYGRDVYTDENSVAAPAFIHNCASDTLTGDGNITNDPLMVGSEDPHILYASPCRGAGDASAVLEGETDVDGEDRLDASKTVDIGCDQYHAEWVRRGMPNFSSLTPGFKARYTNVVAGAPCTLTTKNFGKAQSFVWSYDAGTGPQFVTNAWQIRPVFTNAGDHLVTMSASNRDGVFVYTGRLHIVESFTNYVSTSGAHFAPFTSWSNAATNVQAAIDACYAGGVTLVNTGIYKQGETLRIEKPMTLRSPEESNGDDVVLNGENAYSVLYMDDEDAVVELVKLTRGKAQQGGGARVYAGTLRDCNIEENSAERFGGGVRAFGDARIEGCFIFRNVVSQFGGGIYADGRSTVERCNISQNTSREGGGGVWLDQDATLINSFITGNRAYGGGGVAFYTGGSMRNCTITFNTAEGYGGGVWHGNGSTRNCIIYYNDAPDGADNHKLSGEAEVNYCLTTPGVTGTGNITNSEPRLAGKHIPNILPASAARNAGDSAGNGYGEMDIDREQRVQDGLVDIGCDEVTVTNMLYPMMVRIEGDLTAVVNQPLTLWSDGFGRPEILVWSVVEVNSTSSFNDVSYITPSWSQPGLYPVILTASNIGGASSVTVTVQVVDSSFVNYVSPSGLHVAPYTNWFYAATNVQAAIDKCPAGGTTIVGPGRYLLLDPLYMDKHMTLAGVPDAGYVVLDAAGNGRVMNVNHTNALVHTLTLTGGADFFAAGLELLAGTVSNVVITGNTASNMYGGFNMGGNALLTHSLIVSNRAPSYAGGRAAGSSSVQFCDFLHNEANSDCGGLGLENTAHASFCNIRGNVVHQGGGGGLYFNRGGTAEIMNISSNSASQGAGAYFERGGTLRYAILERGWAFFYGGGAWFSGGGLMDQCVVRDNYALTVDPYGRAGGIVMLSGGILRDCVVSSNQANCVGGVYVQGDGLVDDCLISGNLASNITIESNTKKGEVGGVWLNGGRMQNTKVERNISQGNIGGARLGAYSETINAVISDNTADGKYGGVAITGDDDENPAILRSSTIAYNRADETGGLYIEDEGTMINTIVFGNTANGQPSELVADGTPILSHVFTNAPPFVSATNLRLQAASACINAGTNEDWMTDASDFDGNSRVIGETVDIGVYEYLLTPTNLIAATNALGNCLQLSWTAVNGAGGYAVFRSTNNVMPQQELATVQDAAYCDSTARKGVQYYYWVNAHYLTDASEPSSSVLGWLRKNGPLGWLLLLTDDNP